MNVLFIHPPSGRQRSVPYLPIGLSQLMAVAEQAGHHLVCADLHNHDLSPDSLVPILRRESFDACLMGGFAHQVQGMKHATEVIRAHQPHLPVIAGGMGVSYTPELALRYTGVDAVVTGEGEPVLLPLLDAVAAGASFHEVNSLTFRKSDGTLGKTPLAAVIEDLDTLPFLAYHHFDIDLIAENGFFSERQRTMVGWSARGCSFSCAYCSNSVMKNRTFLKQLQGDLLETRAPGRVRFRSGRRVAEELAFVKSEYGIDHIFLADEEFMVSRRHVEEVCRAIAPLNMTWWVFSRPELATEEKLGLMKGAGCVFINVGIENVSPEVTRHVGRHADPKRIIRGIQAIRKVGLPMQANFIIGLPGETPATVWEAVEFCRRHELLYLPPFLHPYPGSMLFERYRNRLREETLFEDIANRWDLTWTIAFNATEMSDRQLWWVRLRAMSVNLIHSWVTRNRGVAWVLSWPVTLGFVLFEKLFRRYRVGVRRLIRATLERMG